jgi:hypothetical protein
LGSIIYNKKLVIYASFIIIAFLLPVRRDLPEDASTNVLAYWLFELHIWLPLLLTVFVALRSNSPSLNFVANLRFWNIVILILLPVFMVLTLAGVPGLWWSWPTLGTHLTTVMLAANLTSPRLKDLHALALGVGIVSFAAGFWETIYQIGYYQHYDISQGVLFQHTANQLVRISPLTITGLGIIIAYGHIRITTTTIILSILCGLGLWIWLYGYMWVDIYYDWTAGEWGFSSHFNFWEAILYRSTKATLALALISLYSKGIRLKMTSSHGIIRSVIGYSIIPIWTLVFVATTIFLGITWLKSLFAKEGKPPYFKTRSIHYDRRFDSPSGGGHDES